MPFSTQQKLARLMCRQNISAPSERIFLSATGHDVTKNGVRLDPDTIDEPLFLHSYYKKKGFTHK